MELEQVSLMRDSEMVDLTFRGISYHVDKRRRKDSKTILQSMNGTFKSGQLTAILGPSGAGKTTLMSILAGLKTSRVKGDIYLNGYKRNLKTFRKTSAYVTQKDHLLLHLSIEEYLNVSIHLKLGSSVSHDGKKQIVNDVIKTLGLNECRTRRVANLSGGECKRLSIALELVNNPSILFLDEPTSGLDSSSSLQCVSLLGEIARRGRIVVSTVHQPSSRLLEKFDHIYIIAEGKCVYQGKVDHLVPFLSRIQLTCPNYHNPVEYVIDIVSDQDEDVLPRLVKEIQNGEIVFQDSSTSGYLEENSNYKTQEGNNIQDSPIVERKNNGDTIFAASLWMQFIVLLKRTCISIWREKMLTLLRLVAHVIVGILIGTLYLQIGNDAGKVYSNAGLLFFTQLFLLFTSMMPTVLTFPLERNVLMREHLNNWYSLKSYYLAKTIADIPFQIIFPTLYLVIVYFMTDQPLAVDRFFMLLSICIATSLVSQGIGLLVGAAADVQIAVFLAPAVTIPFLLFSGFFVNLNAIPSYLYWITYLSFMRYAFEGSLLSIYGFDRPNLNCFMPYCPFKISSSFLEEFSVVNGVFLADLLALFGFFLFIRIVTYFVLKWKLQSLQ